MEFSLQGQLAKGATAALMWMGRRPADEDRPRFFGPAKLTVRDGRESEAGTDCWSTDDQTELKNWIADFVQAEEDLLQSDARKDEAQFKAFMAAYYTPEAMLIRPSGCPSGKPLTQAGWIEMMGMEGVKLTSKKLLAISHMTTFGAYPYSGELHRRACNGAVVVYTTHEKFTHNGNANDDIASWSVTLSKHGERWMLEHLHRGSGLTLA
jgi:hypothetical protein